MMVRVLILLSALFWSVSLDAQITVPDVQLGDSVAEARARHLMESLRCLVCQNQSIAESDAGLARDLRVIVRSQVLAGRSDGQIIAFMRARYGDFVLLRPPLEAHTLLLWFAPLLVLGLGCFLLWRFIFRR